MLESIPMILAQDDTGGDAPLVLPGDGGAPAPNGGAQGQTSEGQAPGNGGGTQGQDPNATGTDSAPLGGAMWLILLGVILVMFILMSTSQRRERKKHEAMLSSLKKGDKVQTAGGIIGTIVDIRDDEVLVKVDENANTRLRFARSAVRNVLETKGGEAKGGEKE